MKLVNWFLNRGDKKEEEQADEDELKKKGFNPEGVEVQQICEQQIANRLDNDYAGCISPTPGETQQIINTFKFFPNDQEHRHENGYQKGGILCADKMQVNKIRSVGKQMIKLIGKKIISGDLNLTKISFPIKAMVPRTALQNSTFSCCMNPYFMHRACQTKDPIQRFKYVITNTIAANYYITMFLKPLNPIIGQTLQGSYPDGTQIYCEQISHHPPISYFLAIGPEEKYRYYGCYNFSAHAGLNSASLVNKGYKVYEFVNGDRIDVTFSKEMYSGLFIGTLRSEAAESIIWTDKENGLRAEITFGKVKKRPTDYFQSAIYYQGKPICTFDGTYCGYINFDKVRYWDGRFLKAFKIVLNQNMLESDSRKRMDLQYLQQNKIEEAQKSKQELEERQRKDTKLRDKFGPKK